MKTALFFGSFNPIHAGHTSLATDLLTQNLADELWFIVSPNNPLKSSAELMDENIRLEMVELASKDIKQTKACDIEFTMPKPSYTIDTLNLLKSIYPEREFILLIGSDNAVIFDKWKNHQEILDNFQIIVYPRKGYDFKQVENKYPRMKLISTPYYEISSTYIRENFYNDPDISKWLHPAVHQKLLKILQ